MITNFSNLHNIIAAACSSYDQLNFWYTVAANGQKVSLERS